MTKQLRCAFENHPKNWVNDLQKFGQRVTVTLKSKPVGNTVIGSTMHIVTAESYAFVRPKCLRYGLLLMQSCEWASLNYLINNIELRTLSYRVSYLPRRL